MHLIHVYLKKYETITYYLFFEVVSHEEQVISHATN